MTRKERKNLPKPLYDEAWMVWATKKEKIEKYSGKPFKSGNKVGTPILIETNPQSGKLAFRMLEDDTLVDCYQCKLAEV